MTAGPQRFGIVVPWMNTAVEDEVRLWLTCDARLHFGRVRPAQLPGDSHDESYLASMNARLEDTVRQFDGIDLRGIVFACTSASFAGVRSEGECACVFAYEAILDYLRACEVSAMSLVVPYSYSIARGAAQQFERDGVRVEKVVRIEYTGELRDIPNGRILDAIVSSGPHHAVVISCTASYTKEELEAMKGVSPQMVVTSSNHAIAKYIDNRSSARPGDERSL